MATLPFDRRPLPTGEPLPMRLLAAGIPLTLLLDLAESFGPPSGDILRDERGDADWLRSAPEQARLAAAQAG